MTEYGDKERILKWCFFSVPSAITTAAALITILYYIVMITVCLACTRSTRTERSCGRNRNRDNRPRSAAAPAHGATECVARVARPATAVLCFCRRRAIVGRPSSSVVVLRRPSLCARWFSRPWPVRDNCESPLATVLLRARSGGPM